VHAEHTSLHGKSTLLIAQSAQKTPLATKSCQKRKQVPDQQRAEASAHDPAQQQAEQPIQLPAQKPALTHKPAGQPSVAEELAQERSQHKARQLPEGPDQSQAEKLRAAEDLTQTSAQQPAGPATTGQQPTKQLVTQQSQQPAQKPARQPAERQVEKSAQRPVQKSAQKPACQPGQGQVEKPAQRQVEKPAQGPVQKPAQKPAQPQPEHEIFDCQGLRLLPKDTPLCCEDAVHNQAGPEHIAAQLNAYLRVNDHGLGYAAAILGKVAPPPYDAAAGTAQRNLLAPESGEFACLIMKLSIMV